MGHDQLFKDLLRAFFFDFLALFLPQSAAGIDPETIRFIDPQTFTDLPHGRLRIADLVATVQNTEGLPEIVVVHTEIQSVLDDEFGYRMWEYNALLRLRTRRPVISIALLPFTARGAIGLQRYTETLLGQEYTLVEYWQIGLAGLEASDYLHASSVLGPTLAALMRPGAGGKLDLKLAIVERLWASGLDEAHLLLAVNFLETYLELDNVEQVAYQERMQAEGASGMELSELTWADKLLRKGREEGREEGELRAKREIVTRVARSKFGTIPDDLDTRLSGADVATLDRLVDRVVLVTTLDEFLEGL